MQHAEIVRVSADAFHDECDPITLTPALEITHPIAFKDGSGGLKPPIYDMQALRKWILGQKPTFPHTGLYSDLSKVAALQWNDGGECAAEETALMVHATRAALLHSAASYVFYDLSARSAARIFRYFMSAQFESLRNLVGWMNDYWAHHPYTDEDSRSHIPVLASALAASYATYADFRQAMAMRLGEEDLYGALALSYWSAHPIDVGNDNEQMIQVYTSLNPLFLFTHDLITIRQA